MSGVSAAGDADGVIDAEGVGTRIRALGTGVAGLDDADGAAPVLQAAATTARTAASATGADGGA